MQDLKEDLIPEMDIKVDEYVKSQLSDTAKWSKFISIVMFIFAFFILLVGILGGAVMSGILDRLESSYEYFSRFGSSIIIVLAIVVAIVLAGLYYFLFSFSVKIKNALLSQDIVEFNGALKMMKVFFIATTILAIVTVLNSIINLF